MSFRKSIRWRIQAWHGLLLLAMTAGFGVTAYRLERTNAYRRMDDDLKGHLGTLAAALDRGGPRGGERDEERGGPRGGEGGGERGERPPPRPPRPGQGPPPKFQTPAIMAAFSPGEPDPFYYQVWTRTGDPLTKSDTAPAGIGRPENGTLDPKPRSREGFRECYLFTPPGECLLVGRSLVSVDRAMRDFGWKTAGIGGGLLAVGLAVGWWISSRALRPITAISVVATRIAEGNLKERIHTPETDSELGRLASLLDDTFQRLDAAFDEQARFTSDAAHELRTPVSIILAQSQLALSREREPAYYRETIETSQRAAKRMQGLIESLLQLAVLDAAAGPLDLQAGDLANVCQELLPSLAVLAEEKGSTLVADLSPAACRMNAEQIGQIVTNLVGNAVKFSPPGSEIRVWTGLQGDRACFSVHDNGPGIAAEHLPHLFERFYRTDRSRSSATGGTGLGLAICKRIADAHGANLSVESEVGKGSVFFFELQRFTLGS
ncbi:HAMP domain-containing histidine kinase [Luteolibacter arcticus]|uniref:histidine kinase n=1 Tax=Luteolibacter arcticus TaxID=1581411 RepID=A0ABT3GED9_9BACT|nr:HAMP domain-containing sensor histidine kinase [Luteolibacter arcticus]MCW1921384.1 HAMP domain-containing histidine kinase [Luteolibacter arcticus]